MDQIHVMKTRLFLFLFLYLFLRKRRRKRCNSTRDMECLTGFSSIFVGVECVRSTACVQTHRGRLPLCSDPNTVTSKKNDGSLGAIGKVIQHGQPPFGRPQDSTLVTITPDYTHSLSYTHTHSLTLTKSNKQTHTTGMFVLSHPIIPLGRLSLHSSWSGGVSPVESVL